MSVSFLADNPAVQAIRARVAFHSRQHGIDRCLQQLLKADADPSSSLLAELYALWGDPLTPADEQFLRSCLAEARNSSGPILVCGAGLLTLVLGALCSATEQRERQVWCLETDRHWANVVRSWLTEYRIHAAHVIQCQPKLFGDHVWYAVDIGRLAKSYQLVICDGSRATPRGILGAIGRLEGRLDPHFTVLARNVKEPIALKALHGWASTHEAKFALIDKQEGFVKLTRQIQPPEAADATPATTVQTARDPVRSAAAGPAPDQVNGAKPDSQDP
jgi:hypothetical protein